MLRHWFSACSGWPFSQAEVAQLLKGAVTKAVKVLHSSIDFAVEEAAAAGEEVTSGGLAEQGVELDEDPEGKVTVTLSTAAGEVAMRVPREAVLGAAAAAAGAAGGRLSVDAFLQGIVDDAFAAHDTDGNTTLEWNEFLKYARGCQFLTAWFGVGPLSHMKAVGLHSWYNKSREAVDDIDRCLPCFDWSRGRSRPLGHSQQGNVDRCRP